MPGQVEHQVAFGLVELLADPVADDPTHRWAASPRAEIAGMRVSQAGHERKSGAPAGTRPVSAGTSRSTAEDQRSTYNSTPKRAPGKERQRVMIVAGAMARPARRAGCDEVGAWQAGIR